MRSDALATAETVTLNALVSAVYRVGDVRSGHIQQLLAQRRLAAQRLQGCLQLGRQLWRDSKKSPLVCHAHACERNKPQEARRPTADGVPVGRAPGPIGLRFAPAPAPVACTGASGPCTMPGL